MGRSSLVCMAFGALLVLGVSADFGGSQWSQWRQWGQQGQKRWDSQCNLAKLNMLEPNRRVESEAGISEFWDLENFDDLRCAGVSAVRHTINRRGLLLPYFTNAPVMCYVVQGRGLQGSVMPGCPETFEVGEFSATGSRGQQEKHQKVREIREGDVVVGPAGVAEWVYNNGDQPLVIVAFTDVGNQDNQLDLSARRFNLAGNPQKEQRMQQEVRVQSQRGLRLRGTEQERKNTNGNIFNGFSTNMLAKSFNVDEDLARKLQSHDDRRELIVRVRGEEFEVLTPSRFREVEETSHHTRPHQRYTANGVEETFCTLELRKNIDRPSAADIFNPRGGRLTTLNRFSLPILSFLGLTAERGVLYKNAMMAPHFNLNSHSVVYCTRGNGRVQVVDDFGRNVFDAELREGQMLVVPHNFAVVKRAGAQGFEWISLKTNSNAMRAPLAGRISAIRAMPEDVLSNAFRIPREQARNLKYNRDEVTIFTPYSHQQEFSLE